MAGSFGGGQGGWVSFGLAVGLGTSCLPPGVQLSPLGISQVTGYIDAIIAGTSKILGSLQDLLEIQASRKVPPSQPTVADLTE